VELEAHVAWDDAREGPRPAVLIAHAFAGQGDFERRAAERLAALGWVGIALDNYGKGILGATRDECVALMRPFLDDRDRLRRRLLAGFEAARGHRLVDAARVGAIGFCFGGLCALDLARSGAPLRGVVSFHGLLAPSGLPARPIVAKVLALHGHDDPLGPPDQVLAFEREMTAAGVDWQVHVYGGTKHAFTNPAAAAPEVGNVYDPAADRRSWASMRLFFDEALA
jgi:dienelactone hydrolase